MENTKKPNKKQPFFELDRSEYVSECCGAEITGVGLDYSICPDCREHCIIVDLSKEEPNKHIAEPVRGIINKFRGKDGGQ